jgi:sugar phosphate isomerase/epimerase
MRIGICKGPEDITAPIEGLDYIEPTVGGVLCPAENDEAFAARLAALEACPVPAEAANCLIPGHMKSTGDEMDGWALDAWLETTIQRAAKAGITYLVFGSGSSRRVPDDFDHPRATVQLVGHLQRWGKIGAAHGVTIVVEPLATAECNIITSVDEGADVVRRVNDPNVKLLIDTYHMVRNGESPDSIRHAGELIVHAHVAEADGRGPLGAKGEDQRPFFQALKEVGYEGRVSIEAKWDDFAAQAAPALAELRKQIETA